MDFGDTLHKGGQTQRDTTCVAKGQGWWGMGSETLFMVMKKFWK